MANFYLLCHFCSKNVFFSDCFYIFTKKVTRFLFKITSICFLMRKELKVYEFYSKIARAVDSKYE